MARAVERIRAGDFEKIVLAREVAVHAPAPHDAAAVFGVLRAAFGSCFVFCAGRGDAAFVAASPELLVRREGRRASTVALAGSIRRCPPSLVCSKTPATSPGISANGIWAGGVRRCLRQGRTPTVLMTIAHTAVPYMRPRETISITWRYGPSSPPASSMKPSGS